MQTFVQTVHEALENMKDEILDEDYRKALAIYLGLWLSRIVQRGSNMGLWHKKRETLEHPFGRQAIPMTWDYPEANPFSEATGGVLGAIEWISRVIQHEGGQGNPSVAFCRDGARRPIENESVSAVVTDPPYFDAVAYADLSDYFYVWLKRALRDVLPELFITPLTPKSDEATTLKHRHGGDKHRANRHFKTKLAECLAEAKRVMKPNGVIAVMFAHQSTEAWSALVDALFDAGLTIDATWPIDTELTTALKGQMAALASSITVVCRPRVVGRAGAFREVREEIERVVAEAVHRFWSYGLRGADLLVA
jgi:adenine-specific DNA methylase